MEIVRTSPKVTFCDFAIGAYELNPPQQVKTRFFVSVRAMRTPNLVDSSLLLRLIHLVSTLEFTLCPKRPKIKSIVAKW
jgi:hypothetical protein